MANLPLFSNSRPFIGWLQPQFPRFAIFLLFFIFIFLFSSFYVWPQPHLHCHWPPNRMTSPPPGFLIRYLHDCWPSLPSAHPNSVHGLLLSFLLCEATQTHTHTHLDLLCIAHGSCSLRVLGNHMDPTCILLPLYWYTSYDPFHTLLFEFSCVSILFHYMYTKQKYTVHFASQTASCKGLFT